MNPYEENRDPYGAVPIYIKRSHRKELSRGAVAGMIVSAMIVSAALGFGGGMLANRVTQNQTLAPGGVVSASPVGWTGAASTGNFNAANIAAACMDSVVEIRTESVSFANRLMGQYVSEGAGSGVIITADGQIATNNHVVGGATKITVRTHNGKEYEAKLIGTDEKTDLAVIKIEATGLSPATLGTSSTLVVGEPVLAIGNPLGQLGGTVTDGILSALSRQIEIDGQRMTLLQTNASVNPGNSGGGLFDAQGKLIGIVNAKSSGSGIEGLGFAIPIDTAKPIIDQLNANGYVRGRVDIGMELLDVSEQAAYLYRLDSAGVYIAEVARGGSAERAGLHSGDRIISMDKTAITESAQLETILTKYKVGDVLRVKFSRDGKEQEVDLTLGEETPNAASL